MHTFRLLLITALVATLFAAPPVVGARTSPLVIDHASADLVPIPASAIEDAKSDLHVAYGHTSHGSQLIGGMNGLVTFEGAPLPPETYAWSEGGTAGTLDIDDYFTSGDLGNPDFTSWATRTRTYLSNPANDDVNVVMWSWCGQVSGASEANINTYLSLMSALEHDFPSVTFVYMTGHLDGTGVAGNLNQRNEQIRAWVRSHNGVLYDFADIESFDPDGNGYLARWANDACDYDGGNWARAWQTSHAEGVAWYTCSAAHTEPLNANRKAFAAWHLFARLAGWDPSSPTTTLTPVPHTTPIPLPGGVEAENYRPGGFSDTTPGNLGGAYRSDDVDIEPIPGGYAVCYVRDGEWLEYDVTVVPAGVYRLEAWVSSPNADGRIEVLVDGSTAFTIAVPNSGGFGTYTSVEAAGERYISAGPHTLRVRFPKGFLNLDRLILSARTADLLPPVPGGFGPPLDLDGDGLHEDVNGNNRPDFADVVLFFHEMTWISGNEPIAAFDFNANDRIDFADAVRLFAAL